MSDIGLIGLGVFVGVCLTLLIGAAFLVVALVAAFVQRREPREPLRPRVLRFAAGPIACIAVGALSSLVLALGDRSVLEPLDDVWFVFPLTGVAAGVVVSGRIVLRRRRVRERFQRSLT